MTSKRRWILRTACVLTLAALGLIVWAILHPAPLVVIAAMSLGQALGTFGFALFLYVVVRDARPFFFGKPIAKSASAHPPSEAAAPTPTLPPEPPSQ